MVINYIFENSLRANLLFKLFALLEIIGGFHGKTCYISFVIYDFLFQGHSDNI